MLYKKDIERCKTLALRDYTRSVKGDRLELEFVREQFREINKSQVGNEVIVNTYPF